MFIVGYLILCLLVAYLGRNRGLGFLAIFLLSILLTPLITTVILLLTQGAERTAVAAGHGQHAVICGRCSHQQRALKSVEYCTHCGAPL